MLAKTAGVSQKQAPPPWPGPGARSAATADHPVHRLSHSAKLAVLNK